MKRQYVRGICVEMVFVKMHASDVSHVRPARNEDKKPGE